ncbi:MAG TPA: VOC family protein [Xanthomonadaceae bacterium]|nr:VOC family protein [Xanthomonadaceae bacterium]
MPPFHLAFPVTDLEASRRFYVDVLGCGLGRESEHWIDFDLHGHQIVAHLVPASALGEAFRNPVDGEQIPAFHFGLVLAWDAWEAMTGRLRAAAVPFLVEPTVRFQGRVGEQGTFFVRDPSGNALEFKAFRDPAMLFARDVETCR